LKILILKKIILENFKEKIKLSILLGRYRQENITKY